MNVKRCGAMATIGGIAVTWLCLASGDNGLGEESVPAGLGQEDSSVGSWSEAGVEVWLPRALAGDPNAAFQLGRAYVEGKSRREDFGEAAHWLRRAAQSGHGPAQADLARLYSKGLGVPQDYVWSYAWFAAAAENMSYGRARDQTLEMRDMMAAFLSPEDRARAKRLAAQLKELR